MNAQDDMKNRMRAIAKAKERREEREHEAAKREAVSYGKLVAVGLGCLLAPFVVLIMFSLSLLRDFRMVAIAVFGIVCLPLFTILAFKYLGQGVVKLIIWTRTNGVVDVYARTNHQGIATTKYGCFAIKPESARFGRYAFTRGLMREGPVYHFFEGNPNPIIATAESFTAERGSDHVKAAVRSSIIERLHRAQRSDKVFPILMALSVVVAGAAAGMSFISWTASKDLGQKLERVMLTHAAVSTEEHNMTRTKASSNVPPGFVPP